jgi:hypothetical protein
MENSIMATQTLERSKSETATTSQQFRINHVSFGKELFSIKYQLNEAEDWGKPKPYELTAFVMQTGASCDILKGAIRRVFSAEHWTDASIDVESLKMTYAGPDDKPKKGVEPRTPGELIKVAISSSFQSQFLFSSKDLALAAFDQVVDSSMVGHPGYLDQSELEALQDILDEVGRELARQLNKKTVFKPQQMKLF